MLRTLAAAVRERDVTIDEISVGSTPTARFSLEQDGVTELRPGNYVYFDRTQVGLGAATLADCALTVVATVCPSRHRIASSWIAAARRCRRTRRAAPARQPDTASCLRSRRDAAGCRPADRPALGGARGRDGGERRDQARAGRPGARAAEPLVCRVEPGRPGVAGGGTDSDGPLPVAAGRAKHVKQRC